MGYWLSFNQLILAEPNEVLGPLRRTQSTWQDCVSAHDGEHCLGNREQREQSFLVVADNDTAPFIIWLINKSH
jgi:hypothetical protein